MAFPDATDDHYDFEFDNTNVDSALSDFPVHITLARLPSGVKSWIESRIDSSGHGFRITDDAYNVLPYERKNFVASPLSGDLYFKAPTVASASQSAFKLFAENTSDGESATSVWNSGFAAVYHLQESGNGTANEFKDSTSNARHGRGGGGTGSAVPTRVTFGDRYAQDFDGSNDYIDCGTYSPGSSLTAECLIYRDNSSALQFLLGKNDDPHTNEQWGLILYNDASFDELFYIYDGGDFRKAGGISEPAHSTLTHLSGTYNGATGTLYHNGVQSGATFSHSGSVGTLAEPVTIGKRLYSGFENPYAGLMFEVRLSSVARSAAWLKATSANLTAADNELENWSFVAGAGGFQSAWAMGSNVIISPAVALC